MIDPNNVTNFARTDDELLEFWLFCLFVRGKNADVQAKKLQVFIQSCGGFEELRQHTEPEVHWGLLDVRAGQYNTLSQAIAETINKPQNWLRHATASELEAIPGVGPKTARYFLLHSRQDVRHAVIDTHIKGFLATQGCEVPPTLTPKHYKRLEREFLDIADAECVSYSDMDLAIWRASRNSDVLNWRAYLKGGHHGREQTRKVSAHFAAEIG